MKPILVIITGRPGTGKTTLAHHLEKDLNLPAVCKDELKELLFDQLGWTTQEWSQKLSIASYRIMDQLIRSHLATGNGLLVESNFISQYDSKRIAGLIKEFDASAVQVVLHTDEVIRVERFHTRNSSGERHPGHRTLDDRQPIIALPDRYEPLKLECPLIEVDTTDFKEINYPLVLEEIKSSLGN